MQRPERASQRRTVSSKEPLASRFGFAGLKAQQKTKAVWPLQARSSRPSCTRHRPTVLSSEAEAR